MADFLAELRAKEARYVPFRRMKEAYLVQLDTGRGMSSLHWWDVPANRRRRVIRALLKAGLVKRRFSPMGSRMSRNPIELTAEGHDVVWAGALPETARLPKSRRVEKRGRRVGRGRHGA